MEYNEDDQLLGAGMTSGGFVRKFKYTIEIPMFLTLFGMSLSGAPLSNLNMYRTCVHSLNYTVDECQSFLEPAMINHTQELEKEVQKYVTLVNTATSVLEALVPAVLSLFLGVWSDKHGRKPLIVWTLFGLSMHAMLTVVYSVMETLGPWWFVLSTLPYSLTGGYNVLMIGAICFISDVTSHDNRSFRFMIIQLTFGVGKAAGAMLSPYMVQGLGNVYLLLLVATLYSCGYAFTMLFIEESLANIEPASIFTVLKCSHLMEMISVSFKKKPNYGRAILLLTMTAIVFAAFTVYGTFGLLYLYTRKHLEWTMKDYTTFSATSTVMWFVGAYIGVAFVQKQLRISDLTFTLISFFSCAMEYIIKPCAKKKWVMYLGSAVSFFGSVYGPLAMSFLTKTLPSQDTAKAFGLISFAKSFCPLLSPLVYNALYEFTISSFPGAFLVLTAVIYSVSLVLILIVKCLVSRSPSYEPINSDANDAIIN